MTLRAAADCTTSIGHTDVKELALYAEDTDQGRETGSFNLGHSRRSCTTAWPIARQAEPRVGIAYNIKKTQHGAARLVRADPGDTV